MESLIRAKSLLRLKRAVVEGIVAEATLARESREARQRVDLFQRERRLGMGWSFLGNW